MRVRPRPGKQRLRSIALIQSTKRSNDVQEDWEDVSDAEHASQREATTSSTSGSQTTNTLSSRKKRRVQSKTTFHASPTPSRNPSVKERKKVRKEELPSQMVFASPRSMPLTSSKARSRKCGGRSRGFSFYISMLAWAVSRMMSTVWTALSPLCIVTRNIEKRVVSPRQTSSFSQLWEARHIQGSTFEQLVGESAGGSQLSIDVLRAEMATRDLSLLVRYSDLNVG